MLRHGWTILTLGAAACMITNVAGAQSTPRTHTCWRPRPQVTCARFIVSEEDIMGGREPDGVSELHVALNYGIMGNTRPHTAVGGALSLGLSEVTTLATIVRY